jgi:hypothetical protein
MGRGPLAERANTAVPGISNGTDSSLRAFGEVASSLDCALPGLALTLRRSVTRTNGAGQLWASAGLIPAKHGSPASYESGKCRLCRVPRSRARRRQRERRRERVLAGDVSHVRHGSWAAYTTDKCRCLECQAFKSAYIRRTVPISARPDAGNATRCHHHERHVRQHRQRRIVHTLVPPFVPCLQSTYQAVSWVSDGDTTNVSASGTSLQPLPPAEIATLCASRV